MYIHSGKFESSLLNVFILCNVDIITVSVIENFIILPTQRLW